MYLSPARGDRGLCHTPQQRRTVVELLVLGLLSSGFLALFPRRSISVDLGFALFALSLVLVNANYTRTHIWGQWPLEVGRVGWRGCVLVTMTLTMLVILVFLLVGVAIGYQGAGWPGAKARILHPYLPVAILLYLPWALLQQTLFQFYLLGRGCTLCPSLHSLIQYLLNSRLFAMFLTINLGLAVVAAVG